MVLGPPPARVMTARSDLMGRTGRGPGSFGLTVKKLINYLDRMIKFCNVCIEI